LEGFVTTAVMRSAARPPAVSRAAAVLRAVAVAFAVACVAKSAGIGTFFEVGHAAQYRVAQIIDTDPDLLESVPFLLELAAVAAILGYCSCAILFALAARSVGKGRRRSFHLTVFAWVSAILVCLLQPALWLRMQSKGRESTVQILDRIAETLPWWVLAWDVLAAIALLATAVAVALLRTNDALWFRGARS
jgi:hypothetical protein